MRLLIHAIIGMTNKLASMREVEKCNAQREKYALNPPDRGAKGLGAASICV
jgi:hypothetical protein